MVERPLWRKIPSSHPALPDHFPGHPIVPGVVIMSEVWDSVVTVAGRPLHCTGWPQVKFLAPLRPEEQFAIEVAITGPETARFSCTGNNGLLAQGSVRFIEVSRDI